MLKFHEFPETICSEGFKPPSPQGEGLGVRRYRLAKGYIMIVGNLL